MSGRPTGATGERALAAIISYMVASGGTPPTYREIGRRTGIKSTAVVSYHLRKLKAAGLITTGERYDVRAIRVIGATWTPPASLAHLVADAKAEVAA